MYKRHEITKAVKKAIRTAIENLPDMFSTQAENQKALEKLRLWRERAKQPSDLDSWKVKEHYQLVDLGCGEDAEWLFAVAKENPDSYLLGVDPVFERTYSVGNLDLVKAKAQEALPLLADISMNIANADYFLNVLSKRDAIEVLNLLAKKLTPSGELHVSHRREAGAYIREIVESCGFTVLKSYPMSKLELNLTPEGRWELDTKKGLEAFAAGIPARLSFEITNTGRLFEYTRNPDAYQPMRFVAKPVQIH